MSWLDILSDEDRMAMNLAVSATGSEPLYTPEGVQVRCGADRLGLIKVMRKHGFGFVREFFTPLVSAQPPEEQRHSARIGEPPSYWLVMDFELLDLATERWRDALREYANDREGKVELLSHAEFETFEFMAMYTDAEIRALFDRWLIAASDEDLSNAVRWCGPDGEVQL